MADVLILIELFLSFLDFFLLLQLLSFSESLSFNGISDSFGILGHAILLPWFPASFGLDNGDCLQDRVQVLRVKASGFSFSLLGTLFGHFLGRLSMGSDRISLLALGLERLLFFLLSSASSRLNLWLYLSSFGRGLLLLSCL